MSEASANGSVGTEVLARPTRRRFTGEYKRRILEAYDGAAPGGRGAVLRREGLYSSHIDSWRKQRDAGALEALAP